MNAAETLEIIKTLHAVGASHFKSGDFEISLKPVTPSEHRVFQESAAGAQAQNPPSATIPENKEATERLKELIGTMSLSPEALADKIFPAGAER